NGKDASLVCASGDRPPGIAAELGAFTAPNGAHSRFHDHQSGNGAAAARPAIRTTASVALGDRRSDRARLVRANRERFARGADSTAVFADVLRPRLAPGL